MRPIYGILVRMHPVEFRSQFGDQMISIFEDMTAQCPCGRTLCFDAVVSLLRQWLLRCGLLWKALVSIALAGVFVGVPVSHVIIRPRMIAINPGPAVAFEDLITLTITVFGLITLILVATISWSRVVANKRNESCHSIYVQSRSATAASRLSRT